MIWLIPIVVLLLTLYFARQAVYPQQNLANSTQSDTQSDNLSDKQPDRQADANLDTESDIQSELKFNRDNTDSPNTANTQPEAADEKIQTAAREQTTDSQNALAQTGTEASVQSVLPKVDIKPHEAPSLLFANTHVDSSSENPNGELEPSLTDTIVDQESIKADTIDDDDEWDEVADVGDITMDISEMLKELNLRETDSPRLDIDTDEYSQLKTGRPGDVQPEKIVDVAGKLRKMLR